MANIELVVASIRAAEEHRQNCCFHRMHPRARIDDTDERPGIREPFGTITQTTGLQTTAIPATRKEYQPSGQLRRNVRKHGVEFGMRMRCPLYAYDGNDGCAALRLPTCYLIAPSEQYPKIEKKEECPVFRYVMKELR